MTPLQLALLAQAPLTSTTVGFAAAVAADRAFASDPEALAMSARAAIATSPIVAHRQVTRRSRRCMRDPFGWNRHRSGGVDGGPPSVVSHHPSVLFDGAPNPRRVRWLVHRSRDRQVRR